MTPDPKKAEIPSQLLKQAAGLHRKGDLAAAERLYSKLLKARPDQFNVLHLLGILRHQQGRYTEALSPLGAALKINPTFLPALLNYAVVLQALNRPAEALASYYKALAIKPDCAEALNNRGNALRELNRTAEALASFDKALAIKPDCAEAHYNRGNALQDLNCTAEALASFDKALAIKPVYPKALNTRGNALRSLNRTAEALASFDKALAVNPGDARAFHGRGNALQDLGRHAEALASYDQSLQTNPDLAEAWFDRGGVLQGMKRPQEAITAYRQALAKGGDAEVIQYLLASLGADTAPVVAPKKFVTELFDQCADRFEDRLVEKLKYRAPDLLFDVVGRFVPSGNLDTLDLGCGTGLLGARLRPLARTLTGVDLSSNMLRIAGQRQIYDNLICCELVEFLQRQAKTFDLAVATDVFIYIGDLSSVFRGARCALRDGGFFGFSVEASEAQDFVLRATCRYAHSVAYLRKLAEDHGFVLETIESRVIRQQDGSDVVGYLAMLRSS
jgi:predicted TPR repeat methyltransferase/Flp pilus assembly protein TadD